MKNTLSSQHLGHCAPHNTLRHSILFVNLSLCAALSLPNVADAFTEAPTLTRQVTDGKLASIAKRLPEKPEVIKPFGTPGRYGGVL
ncbi:MAG: Peptide transporter, partial [Rhodocyclales bacterium]|nr:Peptide transporter [Rhodocyclales bacterium]